MRERDEHTVALAALLPHRFAERRLPPEALDRELTDEQQDARTHDRDLAHEPRRAVRDLRRARLAIARAARGLAREALRDRGAIREVGFVHARAREPAAQLRT